MAFLWLFYIALEPDLRQRWPHRIISWSRLLAGRWHDPLVGRDLLIGGLFVAGIAAQFFTWCWNYPLTADFSVWYAGAGQFGVVMAAAVAIYGFYTCLARKRSRYVPGEPLREAA